MRPPLPEWSEPMATEHPDPRRDLHLLKLLPNFVTILALCAGVTAIRYAFLSQFMITIALIGLAAVLDALDGRLARILRSESAIGAELDSLGDFVSFGLAPALLLYLWGPQDQAGLGWIAVLVYTVCCMLRLARFNVGSRDPDGAQESTSFIGVPSPAGAILVLAPVYLGFVFPDALPFADLPVSVWMMAIGLLMISRVPTPSPKGLRIRADHARYVLVGLAIVVAALATQPWITLLALDAAYLLSILFLWLRRARP